MVLGIYMYGCIIVGMNLQIWYISSKGLLFRLMVRLKGCMHARPSVEE